MNPMSSNGGAEKDKNFPVDLAQPGFDPQPAQRLAEPTAHDTGASDTSAGNIDKIRDIIFGSNMRDYEQRFARLEETLKEGDSEAQRACVNPPEGCFHIKECCSAS